MTPMIAAKWRTHAMMLSTIAAVNLPAPSPLPFGPQQQMIELPMIERMPAAAEMKPGQSRRMPTTVTMAKPSAVPPMHFAVFTSGARLGLLPHIGARCGRRELVSPAKTSVTCTLRVP